MSHSASYTLLRSHLPPEEQERLDATGAIRVDGPKTKRRYQIDSHSKTAILSKKGKVIGGCCIQFADTSCPCYDRMLAEYLLIRTQERKYLKTAIVTYHGFPVGLFLRTLIGTFFAGIAIYTIIVLIQHHVR